MHRLLVLYGMPNDPDHFRRYYESTHIPLGRAIPGVKRLDWTYDVQGVMGDSPYFCITEIDFDSAEALQAGLAAAEGQAAAADIPNYATGGVTLVHYDIAN